MSNIEIINVVPYNPLWPSIFQEEAQRIQLALRPNCIQIHHIGSTVVEGLHAKPIIDMIPVVKNILDVDAREAQMTALGYRAKGEHGTRIVLALTPHEWQAYHQIRTPNVENLQHLSNDGPHLHFVLYHGIHIVGAAHIELSPNNTAQFHFLGGSPDDHQKRFSKTLFQILQHWLQQRYISILKSSFPVDISIPYKTSD